MEAIAWIVEELSGVENAQATVGSMEVAVSSGSRQAPP